MNAERLERIKNGLITGGDIPFIVEGFKRLQVLEKQIKIRDYAIESASEITEQLVEENKHYKLIKERQEEEYTSVYEENKRLREAFQSILDYDHHELTVPAQVIKMIERELEQSK